MKARVTAHRCFRALPILVLPSLAGCGFLFTQAPPQGYESMDYFSCTESNTGPILDVVWAGLNVLGALVVASDQDAYETPGTTMAVGLGWGVLSGASAGVGFSKTRRCRTAKQELALRGSLVPDPGESVAAEIVQAVSVSPSAVTIAVGDKLQLSATARDSSGGAVTGQSFTWSSSNDAIASVGPAGSVTAHAQGTVVIAARTGAIVGVANVTVGAVR